MCSEFNQIFLLSMSNSELFLVKGDEEGVEFDILKRPSREFRHENDLTASHDQSEQLRDHQQEVTAEVVEDIGDKKQDKCKDDDTFLSRKRRELGELINSTEHAHDHDHKDDEDDDGFKTPTSLNHKIPVVKECPPAPRKLIKYSKRKSSSPVSPSPNVCRSLRLDLTQEVESLFPKPFFDDLHGKMKKARRENN